MTSSQDFGSYPAVGESPVGTSSTGLYPQGGYVAPGNTAAPENTVTPGNTYDLDPAPAAEESSTKDVAKDQAASVAGGAADAAQHVAGVAKEQVGQVTAEAGRQVKQLVGQAQSELSDQAQAQQVKLAGGLHSVGDQLKAMAKNSDQPGTATDLAHQAADKVHQVAGWLEDRDPAAVLSEVRSFARQRPGVFLAVALGAGLVVGRLARGLSADPGDTGSAAGRPTPTPAVGNHGQHAVGFSGDASALTNGEDLYGTGQVPDWTGKSATELGDRQ